MKPIQLLYRIIYNSKVNYIFRNANYLFNKILNTKIKLPPSGIIKIKTDSGFIKLATNQTSYLTQLLFWNGYKSFEYSSIFEGLVKKVDVFFDIGSNIGYYSLLAQISNPDLTSYAFEPATGPLFYLKKNISINQLENKIYPIDKALSNTTGNIEFYEVGNLKYQYLKYNLAGEGNAGTKTESRNFIRNIVKSITLNSFIKNERISKIDLIKMDTEGTEIHILESGKESILKFQPIIIVETLFNRIESELEDFFIPLGYEFYNHTPEGLKKVQSIKRDQDDGIRNCFFVPSSKVSLISEYIT